jgi:tetratricopeptide (TPR) repeat protein
MAVKVISGHLFSSRLFRVLHTGNIAKHLLQVHQLITATYIATVCLCLTQCAQQSQAWSWCARQNEQAISLDLQILGCTTLIQSPNESRDSVATALNNRSFAYQIKGEPHRAIQDLDQAIRLKPDFALAFNGRGVAYLSEREYDRALQDFDQAIRLKPDLALAFYDRGTVYSARGEFDRAIEEFYKAIRLKPDLAAALYDRGVAYARKGDYARAFQDFDTAVRLKPDFAEAFNNRCFAGALTNKALEAALSDCNESLRLAPQSAAALGSRGLVYFRMAHYAQAIADCTASLDRDPKSADALYVRGLARQRAGDPRRGTADIAAAKALDPKIIQTYARLPGMAGAPW